MRCESIRLFLIIKYSLTYPNCREDVLHIVEGYYKQKVSKSSNTHSQGIINPSNGNVNKITKARGRPRKDNIAPRGRGRPRKGVDPQQALPVKTSQGRRGRPPKVRQSEMEEKQQIIAHGEILLVNRFTWIRRNNGYAYHCHHIKGARMKNDGRSGKGFFPAFHFSLEAIYLNSALERYPQWSSRSPIIDLQNSLAFELINFSMARRYDVFSTAYNG